MSVDLRSDNTAGAAPYVLEALAAAGTGTAASYGDDEITARLQQRVSEVFEREAFVFPVVSGTAANALGISALCPPWGAVVCHEGAHILVNEAAATSMFSGGAALLGLAGVGSRLTPEALTACFERTGWDDPHHSQPAVLSVTQATEMGEVYEPEQIGALATLAAARGLRVHLDGARLANALAALGCVPADLTWRAGVEMVSLGATKNGTMTADAIVVFDPAVAQELRFRLKRAGHVASKGRFQSAQLDAYLTEDRWLRSASRANAAMARLLAGLAELGYHPVVPARANLAFVAVPDEVSARWAQAGVQFYVIEPGVVRLVTSWATTDADITTALHHFETPSSGRSLTECAHRR
ncbi:threonine aldolase family protein [Pseudactinotalea terrae]|uniref:threonine aldolase family protein n=1 Tax=Pseudactinotalea terrae TaxID=1743262 RepID=UPI0012E19C20|nr:beta-eliminating lyase-related protein [Pseudactinotalea terrae]